MTTPNDNQVVCDNGGATLLVPTKQGTRKLTFTVEDIPTLAFMLHYLTAYQKEHPDGV